jgi:organic hydroperoxide reductase OsmC/OhrA
MPEPRRHRYRVTVTWTGNLGAGTPGYRDYGRGYEISAPGKPPISGSSDPAFLGDAARWNPEELLVASTAACHKLWYLHLCAEAGIVVIAYEDEAEGEMVEDDDGGGRFTAITLRPRVTIQEGTDIQRAIALHQTAHEKCFVANSLRCPVICVPVVIPLSALGGGEAG